MNRPPRSALLRWAPVVLFAVLAIAALAAAAIHFASDDDGGETPTGLADGAVETPAEPVGGDGEGPVVPIPSKPELERATVWAVGDGADGDDGSRRVARLIDPETTERFLYLGDVYDNGTATEFATNYAGVYRGLGPITAPTPGNHETANLAEGYEPYWAEELGGKLPPYYGFKLAGWEIISLFYAGEDAEPVSADQLEWLRTELSEPGTCRLAFWHAPRYSAGANHGDDPGAEQLWVLLEDHARIVLNAHEHSYQRFAEVRGITEIVAGAGGHELYEVDDADPRLAFSEDSEYGALRLELEPGSAAFAYVTAAGRTIDRGSVDCVPLSG